MEKVAIFEKNFEMEKQSIERASKEREEQFRREYDNDLSEKREKIKNLTSEKKDLTEKNELLQRELDKSVSKVSLLDKDLIS